MLALRQRVDLVGSVGETDLESIGLPSWVEFGDLERPPERSGPVRGQLIELSARVLLGRRRRRICRLQVGQRFERIDVDYRGLRHICRRSLQIRHRSEVFGGYGAELVVVALGWARDIGGLATRNLRRWWRRSL